MTSRRTPDDWQTIIDQYQASGLKASEFCRQNNITASNFYVWRKKLLGESSLEQNLDSSQGKFTNMPMFKEFVAH